jgi:hypothetical protein
VTSKYLNLFKNACKWHITHLKIADYEKACPQTLLTSDMIADMVFEKSGDIKLKTTVNFKIFQEIKLW